MGEGRCLFEFVGRQESMALLSAVSRWPGTLLTDHNLQLRGYACLFLCMTYQYLFLL